MQLDDGSGLDNAKAAADHRARTPVAQALHPDAAAGTPGDRAVRQRAEAALARRLRLPDDTRLEIVVDAEHEEVHFLIRDRATGRLLREVPKAEQQALLDRLCEFNGALVDRAV
jgi:hypothetical protein